MGHVLDRSERRTETDAGDWAVAEGLQPLQRQGEEHPALGVAHLVDLVHDDVLHLGELLAELRSRHYQREGLGGGDEDVRRLAQHLLPLRLGGVAGPNAYADVREVDAIGGGDLSHAGQRLVEVAVDVVGQGLQRGHVYGVYPVLQLPLLGILEQLVDYG